MLLFAALSALCCFTETYPFYFIYYNTLEAGRVWLSMGVHWERNNDS